MVSLLMSVRTCSESLCLCNANVTHKSENHRRNDGKKQGGFRLLREVCASAAKVFAILPIALSGHARRHEQCRFEMLCFKPYGLSLCGKKRVFPFTRAGRAVPPPAFAGDCRGDGNSDIKVLKASLLFLMSGLLRREIRQAGILELWQPLSFAKMISTFRAGTGLPRIS